MHERLAYARKDGTMSMNVGREDWSLFLPGCVGSR